jgi:site-specific DNA recombinase
MGKIAYGRRRTEKKQGTRNEIHVVEQSEFPVYEGQHEAIISEEDWYLAQEKRKINSFKREKVNNPDHAHILSGILKCPCCGKSMYGNIAKAHSKDKKTRYYYYCKNTVTPTGHECSFRLNIEQTEINKFVAKIISAMVNNPRFVEAIQAKIGTAVDTEDMEKQIAVLQGQLKQAFGTKSRLERQMDTLDINDAHYDRKILDLQRRYDEQYDTIEEIEVQIGELQSQIRSIQQEKISGDNIYRLLLAFDEVYHSATEAEQKEFMKAFIERIEMFPEKRKDGSWIKKIVFNFPVPVDGEEVKELPLETETTVETVCLLSKLQSKEHIEIEVKMDELDLTSAESKATYEEIKAYVLEHTGLKVSHLYIAQVKQKHGIIERENYNKPKSEDTKQPQCPPEKEKAIVEALKHFGMI